MNINWIENGGLVGTTEHSVSSAHGLLRLVSNAPVTLPASVNILDINDEITFPDDSCLKRVEGTKNFGLRICGFLEKLGDSGNPSVQQVIAQIGQVSLLIEATGSGDQHRLTFDVDNSISGDPGFTGFANFTHGSGDSIGDASFVDFTFQYSVSAVDRTTETYFAAAEVAVVLQGYGQASGNAYREAPDGFASARIVCNGIFKPLFLETKQLFFTQEQIDEHSNHESAFYNCWLFNADTGNTIFPMTEGSGLGQIQGVANWISTTDIEARGFFKYFCNDTGVPAIKYPPNILNVGTYLPANPNDPQLVSEHSGNLTGLIQNEQVIDIARKFAVVHQCPDYFERSVPFFIALDHFYTFSRDLINRDFRVSNRVGGVITFDDIDSLYENFEQPFILNDQLNSHYVDSVVFDETDNASGVFDPNNLFNTNGGLLYGFGSSGSSLDVTLAPLNLPSVGRDENIKPFDTLIFGATDLVTKDPDGLLIFEILETNYGEKFTAGTKFAFSLKSIKTEIQNKAYFICKFPSALDINSFNLEVNYGKNILTQPFYFSNLIFGNRIDLRCPDIGLSLKYNDQATEWNQLADGTRNINPKEEVLEIFSSWTYISDNQPREFIAIQKSLSRKRIGFLQLSVNPEVSVVDFLQGLFNAEDWSDVENIVADEWQGSFEFSESITNENKVV